MDKHQIGVNAGKVWKLLNDNKRWSYCDLKRASELSDRDLNAAIGWLARENKIDFECSNGDDCLFLSVNVYIGWLLHTYPGAVSVLSLIYDKEKRIQLLIDKGLMNVTYIGCHPCTNTCSLKIKMEDILTVWLPATGHDDMKVIE